MLKDKDINIEELISEISNRNLIERFALFVWGLLLYAASFTLFFAQYNIVTGGSTGLSLIVEEFIPVNNSVFVLIFSLITLVFGYFLLGVKETIKTILGVILLPIFMEFTEVFPGVYSINFTSLFLTVFFGGLIMGLGNGIILKSGFSTGGFQTIYQILYKYFGISISKSSLVINGILIMIGGIFFGFGNALYALVGLYISSIITDRVMLETSTSKTFYIVTEKYKEINQYITDTLGHSATIIQGKGGYTNDRKKVLMCAVPNREYYMAKQVIQTIDKDSFFLITDTYEIRGGM